MAFEVEVTDNTVEVKAAVDEAIRQALEMVGLQAENYAKDNITAAGRIDTGNLRNSITHEVGEDEVIIGSNNEYAVYHEVGTGIYTPGGRQTPWLYPGKDGKMHFTRGVTPVHFLKEAIEDHIDEYNNMIKQCLEG